MAACPLNNHERAYFDNLYYRADLFRFTIFFAHLCYVVIPNLWSDD